MPATSASDSAVSTNRACSLSSLARCTAANSFDTLCLLVDLPHRGTPVIARSVRAHAQVERDALPPHACLAKLDNLQLPVGTHTPGNSHDLSRRE